MYTVTDEAYDVDLFASQKALLAWIIRANLVTQGDHTPITPGLLRQRLRKPYSTLELVDAEEPTVEWQYKVQRQSVTR